MDPPYLSFTHLTLKSCLAGHELVAGTAAVAAAAGALAVSVAAAVLAAAAAPAAAAGGAVDAAALLHFMRRISSVAASKRWYRST